VLVPARHGEARHVDRVAWLLALEQRPIGYDDGRDWLETLPPLSPEPYEVHRMRVEREVHRQGEAPRRAHAVRRDAIATREALECVE
jgi:hypothetical protein